MIINRLTAESEFAAGRYETLTGAFRSVFLHSLNDSDFGSVRQSVRVTDEAYRIAETFIEQERIAAARVFEEIASEARTATTREIQSKDASTLTEQALEHLRVAQLYMHNELVSQIHRDIAQVRRALQGVVLEVSLASRSRGVSQRVALIEYRIGNAASLSFQFQDRQTRRWSSKKYVRALWRHTLLSVYNEIVMLTLAEHGLERAMVRHQDGDARFHNMVIVFGSSSEMPTYSEIKDVVFHPNANAWLTMERKDVPA